MLLTQDLSVKYLQDKESLESLPQQHSLLQSAWRISLTKYIWYTRQSIYFKGIFLSSKITGLS